MIRKTCRLRPSFESLESMVLLSGFSAATHHAAPALLTKLPAARTETNVSGTLTGTLTIPRALDPPGSFNGKGVVSPFGHTTVKGSSTVSRSGFQRTGTFTLTTSKGNIVVDTNELANGPWSMTITKGTKQFKGIVGAGSGSLDGVATKVDPHSGNLSGKFTLTVNLNVTIPTN